MNTLGMRDDVQALVAFLARDDLDDLSAARGLVYGLLICVFVWGILIGLWVFL